MKDIKDYLGKMRIYLMPVIVGLVVLSLLLKIVKPKIKEVFALRNEINEAREVLSRLTEKEAVLASFDQEAMKEQFLTANEALPSEQDVPGFLAQIERLAQESGVLVESVSLTGGKLATPSAENEGEVPETTTEKASSDKEKTEFKSKVLLRGVLDGIASFLDKLAKSRRIVDVEKIYLTSPLSEIATPSAMTAQLTLKVYYQPLPPTLGRVDEPLPKLSQKNEEIFEKVGNFTFLSKPLPVPPSFAVEATPSARLSPFEP
jgi:Tfp pilus assembly protein PilO